MTRVPKGSAGLERILKDMTDEDVQMRISGIDRFIEKHGPSTAKEIGYGLKKTEGWAGVYLQAGERKGVFYRNSIKQPTKWGLVRLIEKVESRLLPASAELLPVLVSELPADVMRTLRVLGVYYQTQSTSETISSCVRAHSAHVVIKDRVSLTAIEEELNRHDAAMERLRKGA